MKLIDFAEPQVREALKQAKFLNEWQKKNENPQLQQPAPFAKRIKDRLVFTTKTAKTRLSFRPAKNVKRKKID